MISLEEAEKLLRSSQEKLGVGQGLELACKIIVDMVRSGCLSPDATFAFGRLVVTLNDEREKVNNEIRQIIDTLEKRKADKV